MDASRKMDTDAMWKRMAPTIQECKSPAGAPPRQCDRDFVEAVLYVGHRQSFGVTQQYRLCFQWRTR